MEKLVNKKIAKELKQKFDSEYLSAVEGLDWLLSSIKFQLNQTNKSHLFLAHSLLALDWFISTHERPDILDKEIDMYIDTFLK